jgi:hypothetical protein
VDKSKTLDRNHHAGRVAGSSTHEDVVYQTPVAEPSVQRLRGAFLAEIGDREAGKECLSVADQVTTLLAVLEPAKALCFARLVRNLVDLLEPQIRPD